MATDIRDWVVEAERLLNAQDTGVWRETHSSFTAWLTDEAKRMRVQPSQLWRMLGAARYYLSLGSQYDDLRLPDLRLAGPKLAPQHLELIEKISRSADRLTVRRLLSQAIEGKLTRRQLQDQWQIYKRTEELLPRRGRDVSKLERAARSSRRQTDKSAAQAIVELMGAPPDWTGHYDPDLFRIFALTPASLESASVDLAALVRPEAADPISVHGIEIKQGALDDPTRLLDGVSQLRKAARNFDFLWFGLPTRKELSSRDLDVLEASLPGDIGVLEMSDMGVRVLRAAGRQPGADPRALLGELL